MICCLLDDVMKKCTSSYHGEPRLCTEAVASEDASDDTVIQTHKPKISAVIGCFIMSDIDSTFTQTNKFMNKLDLLASLVILLQVKINEHTSSVLLRII